MPVEKKSLAPENLVLKLSKKANEIDISKYEDFLFELCSEWDFQKEAIRNILRYYLSGEYSNSKDLFEKNYRYNKEMQSFASKESFIENLPFPEKMACTIDLATGSGKSWVMYAVARILLAEGIIDRVLLLAPSKTIKDELYKKFVSFTSNSILTDALPKKSKILVPGIKHSDETIEEGDICIDNVHKTYDHVSSSITDSLENNGERTLIINDEAHHILNPKGSGNTATMNEWWSFLNDEKFNFKYILNLSGTPYKGNNYFNDVLYRYSIRDAISNKFVKNIKYLTKDESEGWNEKWQAIINNHERLKEEYNKTKKHISIVVTNKISEVNKVTTELKKFLVKNTDLDEEEVEKKVIPVTSSPQHEEYREILKTVDQEHNPVEWIVSVSMLTEGWDVANIFQIVPHDSRAFNSKLLIAQVLGRGLRVPKEYRDLNLQPDVWIYNHKSWSTNIDNLVREVAEISNILRSNIIQNSNYNFILHKISIGKKLESKKVDSDKTEIKLPQTLGFSSTKTKTEQVFDDVSTHRLKFRETSVKFQKRRYSIEEATNAIFTNLYLFDMSRKTNITDRVSKDYISELIKKELDKIGEDTVSEPNLQNAKLSFNVLLRPFTGVTTIQELYQDISVIKTNEMHSSSMSESAFKNNGGLITSKENLESLEDEELKIIDKVKKENDNSVQTNLIDENYVRARVIDNIPNDKYKSPLDITLVSHRPERDFTEKLIRSHIDNIDAWIKSPDVGFFTIPYIHRPGTHSLQKNFNPDFFIKKGNKIIVVEIKAEDDSSVINKDKLEGALNYFEKLNTKLGNKFIYDFHFLDPRDYTTFFDKVIDKDEKFISRLHADLGSKSRTELKGEE